jgi:hypothetical protein
MRFWQKYVKTSGVKHLAWNEDGGRPLAAHCGCAGRRGSK